MKTETRSKKKIAGAMREAVASNLIALMEHRLASYSNKPRELARRTGMSLSSIQRVLSREQGVSIDKLEDLAAAFDLSSYQLLIPDLDVMNPPIVAGATEAERRLYARMRKAALAEKA